jgi:hypothetical protein
VEHETLLGESRLGIVLESQLSSLTLIVLDSDLSFDISGDFPKNL